MHTLCGTYNRLNTDWCACYRRSVRTNTAHAKAVILRHHVRGRPRCTSCLMHADPDEIDRRDRTQLARNYILTRVSPEDLRNAMMRKWNEVHDVQLVVRDGVYVLEILPDVLVPRFKTSQYMSKLSDIAGQLNAWGAGGIIMERLADMSSDPGPHIVCTNDTCVDIPVVLDSGVHSARAAEFDDQE